jgi:head-tail adaptor
MLSNLQNATVNVQAPTPTKGTSGGEVVSWTTTITAMPCRVIDATAIWRVYYAQKKLDITHQVFTNQQAGVSVGYQLLWGTRTLRVIGITDKGGAGQVMQIDCQELQQ